MKDLYEKLAQILDVPEVKGEDLLREFEEWDSITVLSVMTMCDTNFGVALTAEDMASVGTAGDLALLITRRRGE